ncbi:MAG TPA: hypothetical protein PKA19_11525 [Bacillota bacterium]|nr:hypothetical protein [Bacillota bacterium]
MRIESAHMNLQGSSQTTAASYVDEELNMWVTGQGSSNAGAAVDVQEFSRQTARISNSASSSISETVEDPEARQVDLIVMMLEEFLSRLSGKKVKLNVPKVRPSSGSYDRSGQFAGNLTRVSGGGQPSAGFGLIYNRNEIQTERSRVSFAAEGVVKTADGREIKLNLNFNIDQAIVRQSSFELKAGDALKDPLVINFDGGLASFTDRTMSFDIDFDGRQDTLRMLGANSGYLVLDKNDNGTIDDGRELFGPQTDDGYGELAAYDEDGNGWIDENDSIFDHLKIWYHDERGNSVLAALTDKNIGAIYLGSVGTQMNMYNSSGMAGTLRESGLVLLENGESRVMQELDVRI